MYGRRYNKVLTIMLIVIIVAVIALLAYLIIYNVVLKKNSVEDPGDYVDSEFLQQIVVEQPDDLGNIANETENNTTIDETGTGETSTDNTNTSTSAKKTQYKGFDVVGTIEIPKTNVKLPVLAKVTKKSLETSVATIWPQPEAVLNSVGNVVIMGHNYRNGTFFSNNKKLSNGDQIKITGLDGKKVTYIIYNIFETTDTDTSFYNRDTDGKREVTLSTCTDDSSARLIVEAREE